MAGQSKAAEGKPGRAQLVALGMASGGFYLVFGAWGLMENLISTYYAKLGYYSMSLVYFGIGPGALVAPAIIDRLGPKLSLFCACSTYSLYAIAHMLMEFGIGAKGQLLLPAGALVGLTCSTLWTSLGLYTKNLSRAYDQALGNDSKTNGSLGFFNGITDRAAPQLGGLTALTGSTLLLTLTGSRRLLYSIVAGWLVTGNIVFLSLPSHGETDVSLTDAEKAEAAAVVKPSLLESLLSVPKLLCTSSAARKVCLCYLAVGFSQSYTTGTFTADAVAPSIGKAMVGVVMATNNTMEVISALLFGKFSDKFGRYPVYLAALAFELVNPLYFALFPVVANSGNKALMILLAGCLGVGSGGATCCLRSLVGDLFEGGETGTAMSATFLTLSLTAGTGFYLGPNFSLRAKARLYLVLIALSILGSSGAVATLKDKEVAKAAEAAAKATAPKA